MGFVNQAVARRGGRSCKQRGSNLGAQEGDVPGHGRGGGLPGRGWGDECLNPESPGRGGESGKAVGRVYPAMETGGCSISTLQ